MVMGIVDLLVAVVSYRGLGFSMGCHEGWIKKLEVVNPGVDCVQT